MVSGQKLIIPSEPGGRKRQKSAARRKVGAFGAAKGGEKVSRRGAERKSPRLH